MERKYEYVFRVVITEDGKIYLQHNCSNIVELLGILELAKNIALRRIEGVNSLTKEENSKSNDSNSDTKINPSDYLREVMQNTVVKKTKGVISLKPL